MIVVAVTYFTSSEIVTSFSVTVSSTPITLIKFTQWGEVQNQFKSSYYWKAAIQMLFNDQFCLQPVQIEKQVCFHYNCCGANVIHKQLVQEHCCVQISLQTTRNIFFFSIYPTALSWTQRGGSACVSPSCQRVKAGWHPRPVLSSI